MIHLNIRSAVKSLSTLNNYLEVLSIKFKFIGLTETWFNNYNANIYSIHGYKSQNYIRQNKGGGSVSLFVQEDIPFKAREDIAKCNSNIECVFIEIDKKIFNTTCSSNMIIGVIYRPTNTDTKIFLEEVNYMMNIVSAEHNVLSDGGFQNEFD